MRASFLFLIGIPLLASDPIVLQTGDERKPPPAAEARQFLGMVCPSSRIVNDEYRPRMLACQICPRWTGLWDVGTLAALAINYGHFTKPDADQALVAAEGCEPHSENNGGSLLFTKHDGNWRFTTYFEGVITDNCTKLQRTDGRTILVCEREEGHQSVIARCLYTIDLVRSKDSIELDFLVLTDTMPSCGFDYASADDNSVCPLQKAEFRSVAIDAATGDILAQVEFGNRKISEAQAKRCQILDRGNAPLPDTIAPKTKMYEIKLHFDGRQVIPSIDSAAARRIVQDQRTARYPFINAPR